MSMTSACTTDVALTRADATADVEDTGVFPGICGEAIPCCPEDLNWTGGQNDVTIRYPQTIVRDLDGRADLLGGFQTHNVDYGAHVRGVIQQSPAVAQDCAARFVTSPATNPCMADSVIQLHLDDGSSLDILTGIPIAELSRFVAGRTIRGRIVVGLGSGAPGADNMIFTAYGTSDADLLLAVASISLPSEVDQHVAMPSWTFGPFTVTRSAAANCIAAPMAVCMRVFESDDLLIRDDQGVSRQLHPGETVNVTTSVGRFRVTHRAIIRRNSMLETHACADLRPDRWSFEIVRIDDV